MGLWISAMAEASLGRSKSRRQTSGTSVSVSGAFAGERHGTPNDEEAFLSVMMEDQTKGHPDSGGRKLCAKHRHHFEKRLNDSVTATGNSFYQQSQHIKFDNQNQLGTIASTTTGDYLNLKSTRRELPAPVISSVPCTFVTNTSTNIYRTSPVPTFSSTSTSSSYAFTFTNNPFLFNSECKIDYHEAEMGTIKDINLEKDPMGLYDDESMESKVTIVDPNATVESYAPPSASPER